MYKFIISNIYKFIIIIDNIFNKILFLSILIFIGFVLGGCSPRQHGNTPQLEVNTLQLAANTPQVAISTARSEYEAMQKFKAQHGAFYDEMR
jgi:hypothetical protein